MVALTVGTFDLPHFGHGNIFKWCKILSNGGRVVVSLNTDEFVKSYKGSLPVMDYEARAKTILAFKYVDEVVPNFGDENGKAVIDAVRPDLLVIGSDWAKKDYYTQMQFTQDWLDERGIVLCYVPYTKGISTSLIKEKL